MKAAMPLQMPGHLTETEYLQITAFLARENGINFGEMLSLEKLATIQLQEPYNEVLLTVTPTPGLMANEAGETETGQSPPLWVWLSGSLLMIVLVFGGVLWLRHGR
jgi:hypothetical protein